MASGSGEGIRLSSGAWVDTDFAIAAAVLSIIGFSLRAWARMKIEHKQSQAEPVANTSTSVAWQTSPEITQAPD